MDIKNCLEKQKIDSLNNFISFFSSLRFPLVCACVYVGYLLIFFLMKTIGHILERLSMHPRTISFFLRWTYAYLICEILLSRSFFFFFSSFLNCYRVCACVCTCMCVDGHTDIQRAEI